MHEYLGNQKKFQTGYRSSSTVSTLLWLYPFMMLLDTHAHTHAHPARVRDGLPHNGVQETNRMKHNDLIVQDKEPYLCPLGYFIHWSRRLKALDEISDSRKTTHYIFFYFFLISESNLFKHFFFFLKSLFAKLCVFHLAPCPVWVAASASVRLQSSEMRKNNNSAAAVLLKEKKGFLIFFFSLLFFFWCLEMVYGAAQSNEMCDVAVMLHVMRNLE